jgi:hypothetical protein
VYTGQVCSESEDLLSPRETHVMPEIECVRPQVPPTAVHSPRMIRASRLLLDALSIFQLCADTLFPVRVPPRSLLPSPPRPPECIPSGASSTASAASTQGTRSPPAPRPLFPYPSTVPFPDNRYPPLPPPLQLSPRTSPALPLSFFALTPVASACSLPSPPLPTHPALPGTEWREARRERRAESGDRRGERGERGDGRERGDRRGAVRCATARCECPVRGWSRAKTRERQGIRYAYERGRRGHPLRKEAGYSVGLRERQGARGTRGEDTPMRGARKANSPLRERFSRPHSLTHARLSPRWASAFPRAHALPVAAFPRHSLSLSPSLPTFLHPSLPPSLPPSLSPSIPLAAAATRRPRYRSPGSPPSPPPPAPTPPSPPPMPTQPPPRWTTGERGGGVAERGDG